MEVRRIDNHHESQIVKFWQRLLLDKTELTSEGGEPIRIIYPGRANNGQGADFRDAVIATDCGLIKGDIEVHVRSSDWHAHQHHTNPCYNRVILHVVMRHNSKTAANLQNGRSVPTVVLAKQLADPNSPWPKVAPLQNAPNMPCFRHRGSLSTETIAKFLDSSGEKRFLAKAARFETSIAQQGASQSLYQGIMSALGYSQNQLPFLELAQRLPVATLEAMTQGKISDEECLSRQQALLLGSAGLLPSQRHHWHSGNQPDDKWIDTLETLWMSSHLSPALPSHRWHLFRVRPANSPVRRIVAMSHLTLRYKEKGVLPAVINMIKAAPLSKGHHSLETGLMVTTNSYWATHFDFGSASRIHNPFLLGKERAADIVVNVLLPFTFAWSKLNSPPGLDGKSLDLYRRYPKLAVNTVEQHMVRQLGLSGSLINSARRQQGLIHIYHTRCTQGNCSSCPWRKASYPSLRLGNTSRSKPSTLPA